MDHREHDREEFRPRGEAVPTIDPVLHEEQTYSDRADRLRYEDMEETTRNAEPQSECRSCSASIPSGRTKCLFCLSEHITPVEEGTEDSAETILSVIFIAIDARTEDEAVAKGVAACRKLVSDTGPIDGYQLVNDIDDPAPQFVERWDSLPPATTVDSETGQQLLDRLADFVDEDGARWSPAYAELPILYDEWGRSIDNRGQVFRLTKKEYHWLVPALALYKQTQSNQTTRVEPSIPTKKRLFCRDCDDETIHVFDGTVSDPSDPGTSVWKCDRCGTPRHGPDPK